MPVLVVDPHEEPEHPGEAGLGEEGDLLDDFPGLKKLVDDLVEEGIRKYERIPKDISGARTCRPSAKILDEEGVPTRTGAAWSAASLQAILRRHGVR